MKRSPQLDLPVIRLRRNEAQYLSEQVCEAIREAIVSGALPSGSRLPASRVMARKLGISRNTVLAAYEALALEGLIAGRVGSGTRVCARAVLLARLRAVGSSNKVRRLRESGFPVNSATARDLDGHAIYIHN